MLDSVGVPTRVRAQARQWLPYLIVGGFDYIITPDHHGFLELASLRLDARGTRVSTPSDVLAATRRGCAKRI